MSRYGVEDKGKEELLKYENPQNGVYVSVLQGEQSFILIESVSGEGGYYQATFFPLDSWEKVEERFIELVTNYGKSKKLPANTAYNPLRHW